MIRPSFKYVQQKYIRIELMFESSSVTDLGLIFNSDCHELEELTDVVVAQYRSMVIRLGNRFRCAVCSKVARDSYNIRDHMFMHLDRAIVGRIDAFIAKVVIDGGNYAFTCLLCSKVLQYGSYSQLRRHFMHKHFRLPFKQAELPVAGGVF
jgi:hypothetical protein